MITPNFEFDCDAAGHWFYVSNQGLRHENVIAVRSFPVAAPDEGVALVDAEGHVIAVGDAV